VLPGKLILSAVVRHPASHLGQARSSSKDRFPVMVGRMAEHPRRYRALQITASTAVDTVTFGWSRGVVEVAVITVHRINTGAASAKATCSQSGKVVVDQRDRQRSQQYTGARCS
jgi:hypothetical protein